MFHTKTSLLIDVLIFWSGVSRAVIGIVSKRKIHLFWKVVQVVSDLSKVFFANLFIWGKIQFVGFSNVLSVVDI
jgi:hypothetical protein